MNFKEAINECGTSSGDVQGIQVPIPDKKKKKDKIVRRPIKNKVKKI